MGKLILIALIGCLFCTGAMAQNPDALHKALKLPKDSLPYRLNPMLPAFDIMLTDSSTIFNTSKIKEGRPSVLMMFSPDCKHCQATTQMLIDNMDSLKDVNFYMCSNSHDMAALKEFYSKYHLADYKNIKVFGRDVDFFFITYYAARFVPDFAVYDKNKKFVNFFESHITIKELYDATR